MTDAEKTSGAIAALREIAKFRAQSRRERSETSADAFDESLFLIDALEALERRVAALEARPIPFFGFYD